jgi:hypothetical protein
MAARDIQHEIVALPGSREVVRRVVNDVFGTDGSHQVHVARAAHAGDVRTESSGDLYGEGAHTSRRSVDEDPLSRSDPSLVAHTEQSGAGRQRHRRRLLEG